MLIMGIESTAVSAGAAILKDGKLIAEAYLNLGLTHSETLMTLIDSCLKNAGLSIGEMNALAVAQGPGSFTGVRIGVSAVKGLVFGNDIPVYGVSTLESLAYGAAVEEFLICPVMDARCSQIYTAAFLYENGVLNRVTEDSAMKLDAFYAYVREQNKKILLLGDGAAITAQYLSGKADAAFTVFPEIFRFQHASGVAFAAWMRYNKEEAGVCGNDLLPGYLRLPQAERERIKGEKKV